MWLQDHRTQAFKSLSITAPRTRRKGVNIAEWKLTAGVTAMQRALTNM